MKKFRVLVNGRNLLAEVEGERKRMGFYTSVYVEAFTPEDAGLRAIAFIREDAHLRGIALNDVNDPLNLTTDGVEEMETFRGVFLPRSGLSIYPQME